MTTRTVTTKFIWLASIATALVPTQMRGQEGLKSSQGQVSSSPSLQSGNDSNNQLPFRRFSFGVQFRYFPQVSIVRRSIDDYNSKANTATTYNTTSASSRFGVGPVMDANLSERWTIRFSPMFDHLQYTKVKEYYTGGDSSSGTLKQTLTEHTRAGYWDFPVVARYHFGQNSGANGGSTLRYFRTHWFVEGGGVVRTLINVRTGNDTLNSDNTTAYNEIPASPSHRTIEGAIVGLGIRDIDDFHFKLIPEVRYIYWSGPSFEQDSTHTRARQIEVGLSLVR